MSRFSRLTSAFLAATLLISGASPSFANYQREEMIRQQREECQRLGGRFDYPRCYLPDDRSEPQSMDNSCGVGCAIVIGVLGIAATRQAYCKANPGKC